MIIHGDNCDALVAMPAESIDMIFTSPPYDDMRTYGGHEWDFHGIAWLMKRVLKPGGVIVWNVADGTVDGGETGTSMRQAIHFQELGLLLHDTMLWVKEGGGAFGSKYCYTQNWEYCFVFSKGRPKTVNLIKDKVSIHGGMSAVKTDRMNRKGEAGRKKRITINEKSIRNNWWNIDPNKKFVADHPAICPEALVAGHIETWTNPGDMVLDPFAGSGTTLKVAKDMGRDFIGVESNEDYVAICRKRTAQDALGF